MSVQSNEPQARQGEAANAASEEKIVFLVFGPDAVLELEKLEQGKQLCDFVIVDARKSGFLFSFESLVELASHAENVLSSKGAMAVVKQDKVIVFTKDSQLGSKGFSVFDSHAEVYDYSPLLAKHVYGRFAEEGAELEKSTDLAEQILMSSIPVLTSFGIKLKGGLESHRKRNKVLAAVDNYSPLNVLSQRLTKDPGKLTMDELKQELRSLEESKAIYPLFAKVPFLVNCFKNKIAFQLSEYLLASRIVSQDQLDEMLFQQQNTSNNVRLSLGSLAVSKGYLSCRQLEIALSDQAFYGQGGGTEETKRVVTTSPEEKSVQSLVGYLGTTDPSGVLQTLSTNRETGVLSVEYKGQQFRALFGKGILTNAKLGNILGNAAVLEFASVWREGIFVFIQRQPPPDLAHESAKVTKPLDKLLLDSALAQDNILVVWGKLPKGVHSPLERYPDVHHLLASGRMMDPNTQAELTSDEIDLMRIVWEMSDGLTPISNAIDNQQSITTLAFSQAVDRLLHYKLVGAPREGIAAPLDKFQQIVYAIGQAVGSERNSVLLKLSLQATQGYSVRARMFAIGSGGEVGIDLAAARAVGQALSEILKDLDDWQVKYIEYASQEIDREKLKEIVMKVHQ